MGSGNSVMHTVKMVLMCSGAVFMAILLSQSLSPVVSTFASRLPTVWSTLSAWLQPPYLYVIINGIIITIAASSRLHHYHNTEDAAPNQLRAEEDEEEEQYAPYVGDESDSVKVVKSMIEFESQGLKTPPVNPEFEVAEVSVLGEGCDDENSQWKPAPQLERHISPELKPSSLSRFAHHRPPAKPTAAQGGKALRRVAKPKRHETLENTWKVITEGRAMPLARHLKKSDTWENHSREMDLLESNDPAVRKSQTFKERTNNITPLVSSSRLKKEPSLSQDELNRRVEAFINKFNEEMRLQRQQSIEQFMDIINRI